MYEDLYIEAARGLVAGPDGALFVIHGTGLRSGMVLRIPLDGPPTELAQSAEDIAIDGFGDILVSYVSRIERLRDGADVAVTLAQFDYFGQMAVSPSGDLWVAGGQGDRLLRIAYDGSFPEAILLPFESVVGDMAYSPDSVLHVVAGETLYRLPGTMQRRNGVFDGDFEEVFRSPGGVLHGLAFDADGALYLSAGEAGVLKLDDAYALVGGAPFAVTNITNARAIEFARTADGLPTRRLLVAGGGPHLLELDRTAVTSPGAAMFPRGVETGAAVAELLGEPTLTMDERARLDQNGNANGLYDIGDVRAYLYRTGAVLQGSLDWRH